MKKENTIISIITILLGGFFYYCTLDFPGPTGTETGPAFMPRIYSIILMALGTILLVKSLFFKNENPKPKVKIIFLYVGLFLVYVISLPYIGFYVSTVAFLIFILWIGKVNRKVYFISVPLGAVLFIYVFFQQLLNVPLPPGILI
ncbi:tripartite tricarboxylate transporter TctB family protein [Halobacillus salinarum]|uniref:Tripartite tricarboxylate transporter TctB family protein n=1 Tax=Halobacillus salinarum TaxID=2932257 RepID=A0ABY4EJF0_9BACI|nr:tripartite tricarboxylate transporter TctB family protein [Halobacillus salinarum]UOQ44284.1 tripartite tricarboxylate transporter TctB family protein [Halobacillus salinarum]